MFKIGDFSKICQVSIKSLRHWDDIGLLKPAYIDPFTSYRYYAIDQLEHINRIVALRGLGLSLKETARLLDEDISVSEIRGMLRLKQAELRQQIEAAQHQLFMVESRLQQIEHEGRMPDYEVTLKVAEPQRVVTMREIMPDFTVLVDRIMAVYAARNEVADRAASPVTAVFHDAGFDQTNVDVELAFAVQPGFRRTIQLAQDCRLTVGELPGVELLACTIYRGRWLSLATGYMNLGRWIHDNGYNIIGPSREIFHHIGPDADETTITEMQFPVMKL
jgi:DNA-binding transcriptional MerR regulator